MQILHTGTRISPSTICETYKKNNFHPLNIYQDNIENSLEIKLDITATNKNLLHRSKQIPQKPMHTGSYPCQVPEMPQLNIT